MFKNLVKKFLDAAVSTLPISLSVIIISLFFSEITKPMYVLFTIGSLFLIIGLALFSLGIDLALSPIGKEVGSHIAKSKKLWLLLLIPLASGFIIAVAEPGIRVLAGQLTDNVNAANVIIYALSGAAGLFLLISVLRIFLKLSLRWVLIVVYGLMLILAAITQIVNPDFIAVALDGGGVTTGAITVPFLMAFTVGISAVARGRKDSEGDEGFGTVALCTAGPVIIILILALSGAIHLNRTEIVANVVSSFSDIIKVFGKGLLVSMKDVALSIAPIVGIFIVFQIFALKLKHRQLIRIIIGLVYSYIGLTFFLAGVNVGFLPIGKLLGAVVAASSYKWILVPLGLVLGALIVLAEPSIHALTKQVNELTSGVLSRKVMLGLLCTGVSLALGLSFLRVITEMSIWWLLLPIYGLCLILTFFTPKLFTAIAFDSGGVASGPMAVTFALPFVIGACSSLGGNVFTDAFGVVASITMAPILIIMVTGAIYKVKLRKAGLASELEKLPELGDSTGLTSNDDMVIYFEESNEAISEESPLIVDFEESNEAISEESPLIVDFEESNGSVSEESPLIVDFEEYDDKENNKTGYTKTNITPEE